MSDNLNVVNGLPAYGNWGGPGWSGGQEVAPGTPLTPNQLAMQPVDALDALFRDHDIAYSDAESLSSDVDRDQAILDADMNLWSGMWGIGEQGDPLAESYRLAAIDLFNKKIVLDMAKLAKDKLVCAIRRAILPPVKRIQYTTDGDAGDPSDKAEGEYKEILVPPTDPIVLDLDGNGVRTVGLGAGIQFDHSASSIAQATGWISSGDGFLVVDRNGNGVIDDGSELFGNSTPLQDANGNIVGNAPDGFAALAQEDTNGDGLVDAQDANFANLKVWQDLNQDGISQVNELVSLTEAGVASLTVGHIKLDGVAQTDGNAISAYGSYTRMDGQQFGLADVNLAQDPLTRTLPNAVPITAEAAVLPYMSGAGSVRDLQEAASLQTSEGAALLATIGDFTANTSGLAQHQIVETLIKQWLATSTQQTSAQQAAAQGLTLHYCTASTSSVWDPAASTWVDVIVGLTPVSVEKAAHIEQMISALEAFGGVNFANRWGTPSVGVADINIPLIDSLDVALLEARYNSLKDAVYGALAMQTRLKPYFESITLSIDTAGNVQFDLPGFEMLLAEKKAVDPQAALIDLIVELRLNLTHQLH